MIRSMHALITPSNFTRIAMNLAIYTVVMVVVLLPLLVR